MKNIQLQHLCLKFLYVTLQFFLVFLLVYRGRKCEITLLSSIQCCHSRHKPKCRDYRRKITQGNYSCQFYTYLSNQTMHIYKYVQSQVTVLHLHILVTSMTVIIVLYYKNTLSIQIIVQKCVIKPLDGKHLILCRNCLRLSSDPFCTQLQLPNKV